MLWIVSTRELILFSTKALQVRLEGVYMDIHDLQTVLRQRRKGAKDISCRHYLAVFSHNRQCLSPVRHTHLIINMRQDIGDAAYRDVEPFCDLPVAQAHSEHFQNFFLS